MEEAKYDRVAAEYDVWVGEGSMLADGTFAELVGEVDGQRVCSVACGQGREARYLASQGAVVTGVDFSEQQIAQARRYENQEPRNINYLQGDAQTLDGLGDEEFDGAVCHMSLMDIPDLEKTLRSVARVLRPQGWFVFSITHPAFKTPATGDLVDHVNKSARRTVGKYFEEGYWDGPGRHNDALPVGAYHRTLSTYVNTLTQAGLAIEQLREPQQFDRQPVWQEVPQLLYARTRRID